MYDPLLYLGFFVIYTILILIFGRHGFDRSENIKDYFIARRSLGLWTSISTFCATWFSAISMLGFTGLIYSNGYSSMLFTTVVWFLGAGIMVLAIDRLYDYGAVTVPEFFRIRYESTTIQVISGFVIFISFIVYLVFQIQGFGLVIGKLLNIPYTVGLFLVFLFIIYTTFGGLYSVARTDVLNFVLIMIGTVVAAVLVLDAIGGIRIMHAMVSKRFFLTNEHQQTSPFSPLPEGGWSIVSFISSFFAMTLGISANPQYVIRIFSAKNKKTAYQMISISIILISIAYVALAIVGVGGKLLVPVGSVPHHDEIFPFMMNEFITSPLKGLILISIVAATVSTANSQLLILASSVVYDIYQSFRKNKVSDRALLFHTRWLIVVIATLALLIALTPLQDLIRYTGHVWGMIAATFFFPLFGGLYFPEVHRRNAIFSIIGGFVTYIISLILIPEDFSRYVHPAVPSVIISGILFFIKVRR